MDIDRSRIPQPPSLWALVTHIIDGDTFRAAVHLGFGITINIPVRIYDWDTPEISPDMPIAALKAKAALAALIPPGTLVELRFPRERLDAYSRVLAYVNLPDGSLLIDHLDQAYRLPAAP